MTFWMALFGVMTLTSAAGVVLARSPLNSALWLVVTFFLVAAHYAILQADFLAAVQVLVYAGAIMVLVIFVIMLLGQEARTREKWRISTLVLGALTAGGAFAMLNHGIMKGLPPINRAQTPIDGSAAAIGDHLFTTFLFPFELTSLLLLGSIIGAVVLGAESKRGLMAGRGLSSTRKRIEDDLKKAA